MQVGKIMGENSVWTGYARFSRVGGTDGLKRHMANDRFAPPTLLNEPKLPAFLSKPTPLC